jgi:hypothetical protein
VDLLGNIHVLFEVDTLDARFLPCKRKSGRNRVNSDDMRCALEERPMNNALTNGSEAPDTNCITLLNPSIDDSMIRCSENIREVYGLFVCDVVQDRK